MPSTNAHNDQDLISQLNKSNGTAFKAIFDRYWDHVYVICYQGLRCHEDAKELTQEIFKSLWERRAQLNASGSLKHYLSKAAKFQLYNFYRNQKITRKHLDYFLRDFVEAENSTENDINYFQLKEQFDILLDRLPGQCKTVFHLSRKNNLSHKQIAKKLNISIKTVEYHISNARRYLAKELRLYS